MAKFYDTNALLELGEAVLEDEKFYFSSISLIELENIKTNRNKSDEVKYKARRIIRILDENEDSYEVVIYDGWCAEELEKASLDATPDNKICACYLKLKSYFDWNEQDFNVEFVTGDICCRAIAREHLGINTTRINDTEEEIYKGYKLVEGNSDYITKMLSDASNWRTNEYAIIRNTKDGSESEMRFDGEKFVNLKLPPSRYIKGKNALQRCALDILNNPDITIAAILGGYGSGKTFLSMRMALYNVKDKGNHSKILGIREPQGEGKAVGFLPGELDQKTNFFFMPLVQQLDGGEFELEELKRRGILESNIPYYMKGTTYNDTIIVVDEAEDLDEKQIRLIGTRLGENSKIYLAGDYKQSVFNSTESNALIRMCNAFKGNEKFGCIYLGEDVRSTTSRMFADLFTE